MTLHIVRRPAVIPVPVADGDSVVYLEGDRILRSDGSAIDHDHLLELVVAAHRVITW